MIGWTGANSADLAAEKMRFLSFADGRRGAHERNCISKSFISFIHGSFQGGFQFLQAITIPARSGIRRDFKQLTDFFKSVFVPDLQYDDLALVRWQLGQATHRFALT